MKVVVFIPLLLLLSSLSSTIFAQDCLQNVCVPSFLDSQTPTTICSELCNLEPGSYSLTEVNSIFNCSIQILNDTCFSYLPLPGLPFDTLNIIGCNETGICDTILMSVVIGGVNIKIEILTDNYPAETSWNISDGETILFEGGNYTEKHTVYSNDYCLNELDSCLTFSIFDTYGDGICCAAGDGYYKILVDGVELVTGGDYGQSEIILFGCPPTQDCISAVEVELDAAYTTIYEDSWYTFTPDSLGQYLISTCAENNNCQTAIWIYDYCQGLEWNDSPEGSIYYSNIICEGTNLAELNANLMPDKTYYIRIGDVEGDCIGQTTEWLISYTGPIIGCTDPDACNFDPIAQVSNPALCLEQGDPNCPAGPDLIIWQDDLESSIIVQKINTNDDCFVEEQCLSDYGQREIMRFTTRIENIGDEDYYIGPPPSLNTVDDNPQWEWDPCHGHMHYEGYAEYLIYDEAGTELPVGFKTGFCVMDLDCSFAGGLAKYSCENQGISVGCGDIYSADLDCQWIDITDLETGIYTLVVRVNWDRSPDALGRHEKDYNNNWAQVCMQLNRDALGDAYVILIDECDIWEDCLGDIYGDAQPDCTGVCDGPALRGDVNADGALDSEDIAEYINITLNESDDSTQTQPTTCTDLNEDGLLNATDGLMVLACLTQESQGMGDHDYCELPYSVTNFYDTTRLQIETVNQDEQYIDISIHNPSNEVLAFQFDLNGINITSIENIIENDTPINFFLSHQNQQIVGLSQDLIPIERNPIPSSFLRVYFNEITDSLTCIENVHSIVNEKREEVIAEVAGECKIFMFEVQDTNTTSIQQITENHKPVKVIPNPFNDKTVLHFDNPNQKTFELKLYNNSGKLLRHIQNIKGETYELHRQDLPVGIYYYTLSDSNNYQKGKLIVF